MDAISVLVRRGSVVEARHRVHAAIVERGRLVESAGDVALVSFLRSSAKPVQALPLVRAEPGIPDDELAIASASHGAAPAQLAAVERLLARGGSSEGDLECGPVDGSRLRHNCSGKHAGMLCVCARRGWPKPGYRLPEHPLQQEVAGLVAEAAGLDAEAIPTSTDGCGVVTFALTLERTAAFFGHLAGGELDGASRVCAAMRAHPDLVEGPGSAATEVMKALPGAVAKGGAEGLLCIGLADGTGVALKCEDGESRATAPAAARLLGISTLLETPVVTSRGDLVGAISTESQPDLPLFPRRL